MILPAMPRQQQAIERIREYEEFAKQHTHEQRVLAGEAAIAILFCTDWNEIEHVRYLSPALERLEAFAGEAAWLEAAHRINLMRFTDGTDRESLEAGINSLRNAFNLRDTPQAYRWWREVIRHARLACGKETHEETIPNRSKPTEPH